MIRKWFRQASTTSLPCAAELGFVSELVLHEARYRRNRAAWNPHLLKTREYVQRAAMETPGRDLAVVAGSGFCLDIDLRTLAKTFRSVVLVDVVHPLEVKRLAAKLRNVTLLASDLTGVLEHVARMARSPSALPLPAAVADIPLPGPPDLVVSVNTLAQLPLLPMENLWRTGLYGDAQLEGFARDIMKAHLDWLKGFDCARRLVTDVAWLSLGGEGTMTAGPLRGTLDLTPEERWEWRHAPRPEAHPDRDVVSMVGAFTLPG